MKYAKKRNPFKCRSTLDWMRLDMEEILAQSKLFSAIDKVKLD